ncbi:putative ferric reductase transmembrane protein [Trypanosoma cruzi]|uniref:Ferric reductase transmembrane protein, putative n=3 Tax=Trypanosoma cruzi TaxID=5693 RepID=Q4DCK3_TRYCC|nr:ferric reductase transmembrane protein, putative [Trypanosoma cruzi]EAN90259.1 ferric reductase transmembrane protein, putative [Trypanosoma cruzi]PWV05068.1 putative ferric reductase transmembrane protein [Trypanosoma cruzi]|eukprot:XP_812110.1 ferric reductase transmembrane protein [Trypanosoma cruzi strain CL Brener]
MEQPHLLPAVLALEQDHFLNEAQSGSGVTFCMELFCRSVWTRRFVSISSIFFFVFVVARARTTLWTDVFVYHPILMAIAFFAIIPELLGSIFIIQGYARDPRMRCGLMQAHRRYALILKTISAFGIIAVEWSKFRRSKAHLVTWHARIGGVCELSQVLETLLGLTIYYRLLDHRITTSQRAKMRLAHRYLGVIVVVTGLISMSLGMLSHFALRVFEVTFLRLFFAILPVVLAVWAYFGVS